MTAEIRCIQDLLVRTSDQYFAEQRGHWVFRGQETSFMI